MSARLRRTPGPGREFGRITSPDVEWLAHQPEEDILLPELPIIDAHHHLGHSLGIDYPVQSFVRDVTGGHNVIASVAVEWHNAYRAHGPSRLRPVGETEYLRQAHVHAQRLGQQNVAGAVVGSVDLSLGAQVSEVLDAHREASAGRFRGARINASHDPHPAISLAAPSAVPHLLAYPSVRSGARAVAATGLPLDVWVLGPQLLDIAQLAAALPELTIVVNHCGAPLGYGPYAGTEHFTQWGKAIQALARHPNVVCKLGGLVVASGAYDYVSAAAPPTSAELARAWRPFVQTCIEEFGPQRCMFESNFPIDKIATGYTTLWNAFKRLAADATAAERDALFAGTAQRIYQPDQADASNCTEMMSPAHEA